MAMGTKTKMVWHHENEFLGTSVLFLVLELEVAHWFMQTHYQFLKLLFFKSGSWKDLEDWESELKPHYQTALKMLGANKNPQFFDGDKALKELAKQMGREREFDATNVAVYFGTPNKKVKDPYFNGKGPDRSGCNFCGACMTGCRHNAKNTLDKNYLYLAQQLGVEILAEKKYLM